MNLGRGTIVRKFGSIVGGVLLVFLGVGGFFLAGNWLFTIRNVEVVGEGISVFVDEERFVKNLLLFPSEALRAQLLRDYPLLADVEIRKKFPNTLVVVARPRAPLAQIISEGKVYEVAKGAVVLGPGSGGSGLPRGYFPLRAYSAGDIILEPQVVAFVAFLDAFPQRGEVAESAPLDGASIQIKFAEVNIYIAQDADIISKASTLQTLIAGFRIKGTLPAVIDLRFDKPIVTF
jgi:hypothetical protein